MKLVDIVSRSVDQSGQGQANISMGEYSRMANIPEQIFTFPNFKADFDFKELISNFKVDFDIFQFQRAICAASKIPNKVDQSGQADFDISEFPWEPRF